MARWRPPSVGQSRRLFLAASLALPAVLADLPPQPSYPGLRLAYEDDFNGPLNGAVYTAVDGYVQTPWDVVCYKSDDAYTENGNLVIRTRRRDAFCGGRAFRYTSGWVDTVDKFSLPPQGGQIEVHAKLPYPAFRVWSSSWAISQENRRDTGLCWPVAPEIDLYEVAGGFTSESMCGSAHWGFQCFVDLGRTRTGCRSMSELDYWQNFHTYAVRWTTDSIQWYVDGSPFHYMSRVTDPTITLPLPHPMIMIMNTALAWWLEPQNIDIAPPGIGDGAAFHYIDWVRYWAAA